MRRRMLTHRPSSLGPSRDRQQPADLPPERIVRVVDIRTGATVAELPMAQAQRRTADADYLAIDLTEQY